MDIEHYEGAIEALLFAMGKSVSLSAIAKAIGHDTETTRKLAFFGCNANFTR